VKTRPQRTYVASSWRNPLYDPAGLFCYDCATEREVMLADDVPSISEGVVRSPAPEMSTGITR
jgi:hypothetical protein